jgi:hypothetical protein
MRKRRTSPFQGFGEVREVDICGEICLAGAIKWVGERMALERLNTRTRARRVAHIRIGSKAVRRTYVRGMSSRRRDDSRSLLLMRCPLPLGR